MDDIVSHNMAADYKVYERRNVIRDLTDCPEKPSNPIGKICSRVRKP